MAITMKLKHLIALKNGSIKFRRRLPVDVYQASGKQFFEITMKNSDTATVDFHKEFEALMREWQALVDTYRARKGADVRSPEERYKDALRQRTEFLTGVTGLDEWEARDLILEQMGPKMDPLVRSVLINPEAGPPAFTLEDARNKYVKDKGIAANIKKMQRLDRAYERLTQAGLNAKELALVDLRKAHGQAWLDALKAYRNENTGKPYAVDTMQRMTTDLKAIVNHAISFVDFDKPVTNPFMRLPFPEKDQLKAVEVVTSMPDKILSDITARIDERSRIPELATLWRLLVVTGCRLSEIGFLQMKDVDLEGSQTGGIPVVHIRPNEFRRIKDLGGMRTLPLTGEGLDAARKHIAQRRSEGASLHDAVFPAYAKVKNNENATATAAANLSKTLMKHVRAVATDDRLVVHSLRHRLLDKLRDAGASEAVRDPFAGHSPRSTGDKTYGSVEARVRELHRWIEKAAP
ncbi:tyrosine-type recombinase/integrase [Roseovarius dicentrarchi]|uniref:tyrosine-type recombinase/integrase n=1 Tax=Roseovarius dicentrarchi TaxID=2250573 RepID=UPI000DE94514|nr:tyrosine-type recombinase/integrase [Roseovarius dicentrarchi]